MKDIAIVFIIVVLILLALPLVLFGYLYWLHLLEPLLRAAFK